MTDATCVITPRRAAGEPVLPASGLLFVNPGDAQTALAVGRRLGGRPAPLFHSNLLLVPGPDPLFIAGPAVGASMAAMTLEKLIALGARKVVMTGWAGALREDLSIADLVLPTTFLSEEGTSRHYPQAGEITTSARLRDILTGLFPDSPTYSGRVWTTDAPYRETFAKISAYRSRGVLAVDMESSALAAVALFRSIEFAALLLISDELYHEHWRPGFVTKSFKKQEKRLVETLVMLAGAAI